MNTYGDLLKDPRWQKKRLEVMSRDNFTCQHCNSTERTLNVHHFSYSGKPWESENSKLITLCEECHHIEENLGDSLKLIFREFPLTGVLRMDIMDVVIDALEVAVKYQDRTRREAILQVRKEIRKIELT